jgi:predicted DNA-binding antitoxin AbrB/MazE fold protein
MIRFISALFDGGVFKPLVPVDLAPGTRVEFVLPDAVCAAPEYDQASWLKFVEDMAAMPNDSPDNGFSNRDHDRAIYGP